MSTLSSFERTKGFFGVFSGWILVLLTFVLPLFFLPWTSTALENNKQLLFVFLTVVALVAWLGQIVSSKRLAFVSGWMNLVPALYLGAVFVSALTSMAAYQTWVGQNAQEYMSFLSISLFVFLFYLVLNRAGDRLLQTHIISALFASASLSGLLAFLGIFGVWNLPFSFASTAGFNTVGTINNFAMFLSLAMFVGIAAWVVSREGRDRIIPEGGLGLALRLMILLVTSMTLVLLVALDFWVFWVVNIVAILLMVMFAIIQEREFPHPKRLILPVVVLLFSVAFLFIKSPFQLSVPIVVSPSYETSWEITRDALSSSTSNLLFGTGPGTFLYDYLAFKPANVNESAFWQLRFDRAKSATMTHLATMGVVGTLLWFGLMLWVAVKALGRLLLERDHEEWKWTFVLFSGWLVLFVQHLLYSTNFTLSFLLWLFTGLLAAQVFVKEWEQDFGHAPRMGLLVTFAFALLAIGAFTTVFITGSRFAAEVAFARAIKADQQEDRQTEEVIEHLQQAVKFNRFSDIYQRNLSSAYLAQARELIALSGEEMSTDETQAIADTVSLAVNAAAQATRIEPNFVSNWVVRGSLYRDLMSFARGAEDLAAQSFVNAISLEPINPVHRTNLGRVYLLVADRARTLAGAEDEILAEQAVAQEVQLLQSAEQTFSQAIEQKSDYLPAHYYLAATYERQGRLAQAVERITLLRQNNPTDIGIGFQLSQLLIRGERYDEAQAELERLVELYPDYSNALWYLAIVYEQQGDVERAIEMIMRVVELNPDSGVAQERLGELLQGIAPPPLPEPIQGGQDVVTDSPDNAS